MKRYLLFIFLFSGLLASAQENRILVFFDSTNEPVPYATIKVEETNGHIEYSTSNLNGECKINASEDAKITISFMGCLDFVQKGNISKLKKVLLKENVFALDQVVVTGQNKPMLKDSSIYEIRVFDSNIIKQRGAVNLGDVLKAEPTIKIKQSGSFGSNINILGLGGENVKIMIDGVPIIGRLDGNLDLSQITLENVDHIEVVEGPMSVIYGSNALAGTINIITKNNKWNKYMAGVSTYVETPGTLNIDGNASAMFDRNVITASLSRNFFEGISFDNTRESKWKGSTQYNGEMRYAYNGNSYQFRMSGKYFDEFMKDKGAVDPITLKATDINFYTKRYSGNAFFDIDHNSNMQSNFQTAISYYDRVMQTVRKDMTDLSENQMESDTTSFVNFMTRATFNHYVNKQTSYQTGVDINTETGFAKRIQGGSQYIADYALFITSKHTLFQNIVVQPGLRYAYNTSFKTPLLYSVNLMADFADGWQSRASYATGFRAPTLKEMYLDFAHAGINVLGNNNLKAESSNTFNASLSYTRRHGDNYLYKFEVKGYFNDVYDMIDFQRVADVNGIETWQNINVGNVQTLGWVSNFNFDYSNIFSFSLSYSRSGITSLMYNTNNFNDKFIYSNNYLTAVTYRIPDYDFSTRLEYSYNGEEPARFIDQGTNIEPMVEAYHDLNFSITKSFIKKRLSLSLGVKNIFDNTDLLYKGATPGSGHNQTDLYRMLSWGRSYFVKVNIQLNKN